MGANTDGEPADRSTDRTDARRTGSRPSRCVSRRDVLKATAGVGVAAAGVGAGLAGSAAAGITEFEELGVSSDNRIVTPSDETFVMRGLSVPDPKRLERTKHLRGKSTEHLLDLVTDAEAGWYPRVIRIPVNPVDVGEHPNGDTGPAYGEDSPPEIADDRRRQRPPQPVERDDGTVAAFTQDQLDSYLRNHLDPAVQRCKERGVYCIVDYHRHWHEQPPGDGEGGRFPEGTGQTGAQAENHLPYDSEYTNYWARNTYFGDDGTDVPASWGYVDQAYVNESGYLDPNDSLSGTPYEYEAWQVNEALVSEAVTFWETVAERYADESHVIYEPYDEPTAPGIWGPVEGCHGTARKQKPLWETFRTDFARPILEAVRAGAPEKLLLMGLPGWSTATQALHWGGFDEEGFENVAATWHNAPEQAVSREGNWLNEPTRDDADDCTGWEPVEYQGLQNAQSVHPIAVTQFGWQDPWYTQENTQGSVDIDKWIDPAPSNGGTTHEYGDPLLDALESDERLSWVAWCADVRWEPTMFRIDFPIAEKTLELTNGSWYETPREEYPVNCAPGDMPCDWALWQNPNMGQHVKDRLAEYRDAQVPFETTPIVEPPTETTEPPANATEPTATTPTGPPAIDGNRPTDPDEDGKYEDLTGNGETDPADVVTLFEEKNSDAVAEYPEYYDFSGNGEIEVADVVHLFEEL